MADETRGASEGTAPVASPGVGGDVPVVRVPLRIRISAWNRRRRFRKAVRLVRGMDGMIVGKAAYEAAVLELGKLAEQLEPLLHGQTRKAALIEERVEMVVNFLRLGVEVGDPALQVSDLMQKYGQMRVMMMSKKKRDRLMYTMGLQELQRRKQPEKVVAVRDHLDRVKLVPAPPEETTVEPPSFPVEDLPR